MVETVKCSCEENKMITTVWLFTFTIKVDELTFSQDYYGTSEERMLIVASKSYNHITEIVEAWSY